MDRYQASRIFVDVVKRPNIMTPDVVEYQEHNGYVCEIAKGRDMDNKEIYGVTVVDNNLPDPKHDHERSRGPFYSLEEAKEYIRSLI